MTSVLIIDDSALLRERLARHVRAVPGMDVVGEAENVAEAIELFRRTQPAAVVLDIQIPGGTGIDVLDVIKKERPETVVIMLTNYPLPQLRKRCLGLGAEFFFDKSSEFDLVARVLGSIGKACLPAADDQIRAFPSVS